MSTSSPQTPRTPPTWANFWLRISPNLIPFLAVITAFLFGIPLIILTERDIAKGIETSGVAYAALIEGVTGIANNDLVSLDNFENVLKLAQNTEISQDGLTRQARPIERVANIGVDNLKNFERILTQYPIITDDDILLIGANVNRMRQIGSDRIRATGLVIQALEEDDISRADVKKLTTLIARKTSLTEAEKAEAITLWGDIATLDAATLAQTLEYLNLMNTYTAQSMSDFASIQSKFDELGIDLNSADALAFADMFLLSEENPRRIREAFETLASLEASGVTNPRGLGEELRLLGNLYSEGLLTSPDVKTALDSEIPALLQKDLIVRRPGDLIVVGKDMANQTFMTLSDIQNNPVWTVKIGGSALMLFTSQLELSIFKSIPFIIVGVAVGLGFIAGVFNIGAEGQLRMGAIIAVWIGISLTGLPSIIHIPLVLLGGLLGGLLWGAIPGLLKAFTGASEVVMTIMLNYIAALFIDYLIKADPKILGNADNTKTPPIELSAHLPTMSDLPLWFIVLLGVSVFVMLFWSKRNNITPQTLLRPLILAGVSVLVMFFMQALDVTNRLHVGFLIMLAVVFGVDWFLQRTVRGFELRTVGINQSAAKYAGMNVSLNVVLAMALSGLLAGFAGAIEISGASFEMTPSSYVGFGFDSISVALLARKNPRYMILSGFLWGGLLSAAALMQKNAGVSIDLVRIIQALIIMFVAADQIIRFIYRVPKTNDADKLIFSGK
jgi:simple sugar transport system permease protein